MIWGAGGEVKEEETQGREWILEGHKTNKGGFSNKCAQFHL